MNLLTSHSSRKPQNAKTGGGEERGGGRQEDKWPAIYQPSLSCKSPYTIPRTVHPQNIRYMYIHSAEPSVGRKPYLTGASRLSPLKEPRMRPDNPTSHAKSRGAQRVLCALCVCSELVSAAIQACAVVSKSEKRLVRMNQGIPSLSLGVSRSLACMMQGLALRLAVRYLMTFISSSSGEGT